MVRQGRQSDRVMHGKMTVTGVEVTKIIRVQGLVISIFKENCSQGCARKNS